MYRCYIAPIKSMTVMSMKYASDNCKHIGLKTSILDSTGLTLTQEHKRTMIDIGYEAGVNFLNELRNPDKYRILLNESDEIPNINTPPPLRDTDTSPPSLSNLTNTDTPSLTNSNLTNTNLTNINNLEDYFSSDDENMELEYITQDNDNSINSLMIPITPEIRINLERVRRF